MFRFVGQQMKMDEFCTNWLISLSMHLYHRITCCSFTFGYLSDSRARGLRLDTQSGHILSRLLPLIQEGQLSAAGERRKYVHLLLVNRLRGLSLPRNSVVRVTDRTYMTIAVYRGPKAINQQQKQQQHFFTTPSHKWNDKTRNKMENKIAP